VGNQPSFCFPQSEHIKHKDDFSRVIKVRDSVFVGDCRLNKRLSSQEFSRLGFIVGRKVGCSPVRNRWKRIWKEAFRLERPYFKEPLDVIVQIKPKANMLDLDSCREALRKFTHS
jgi:ribonuclease P protein component